MKLQLHLDKLTMSGWVDSLCPWDVIAHLTFRWVVSLDGARRGYERFMRRALPHLSYFFAEEANPSRDGYHVHALWGDCETLFRKEAWAAWFKRFGRARIEPVRNKGDVVSYCSKYVTKEGAWWNVKLQWHRVEALNERGFVLRDDAFGRPKSFLNSSCVVLPDGVPDSLPVPSGRMSSTRWKQIRPGLFAPVAETVT